MSKMNRRDLLLSLGGTAVATAGLSSSLGDGRALAAKGHLAKEPLSKQDWMAAWMNAPDKKGGRDAEGQLWLGRFLDPIYFLLKPIAWRPSPAQAVKYDAVEVPAGFVTDL